MQIYQVNVIQYWDAHKEHKYIYWKSFKKCIYRRYQETKNCVLKIAINVLTLLKNSQHYAVQNFLK